MSSPPPELAWIGIIGGIVGIVAAAFNLSSMWRNRRRIEFRIVSATRYSRPWYQSELDASPDWWGRPGARPPMKEGESRRAFIILEFAITNEYPIELTVGRFVIDGWMFAEKFTPHMYSYIRDYRVFDLYTQEPTGLDAYRKVSAKGSYALRVEISEEAEGPAWRSSKSRYVVDLPEQYVVEFQTDVGAFRRSIKLPSLEEVYDFRWIYRWSDLLGPTEHGAGGAPPPQARQRHGRWTEWSKRVDTWYRDRIAWLRSSARRLGRH